MKVFFLIFLFFFLVSCSEVPNCSESDTSYVKYTYNPDTKQCEESLRIEKDICGNGVVEIDETFCNCPDDVDKDSPLAEGGCSGNKGDYLKYYCNEETSKCDLKITDKVRTVTKVLDLDDGNVFFKTNIEYSYPFMVDRDKVKVSFNLFDLKDDNRFKVKNLIVEKIKIQTRGGELLGEISPDKVVSSSSTYFSKEIPFDKFKMDVFEKEYRNIILVSEVYYILETYKEKDGTYLLTSSDKKKVELEGTFESKLVVIDPDNKNEGKEEDLSVWND